MKTFNFDEALIALQSDLLGFAYKLTADKHDAEDLLQETMLKALDNKDKLILEQILKAGCISLCVTLL